jgi:hypothetical protein
MLGMLPAVLRIFRISLLVVPFVEKKLFSIEAKKIKSLRLRISVHIGVRPYL